MRRLRIGKRSVHFWLALACALVPATLAPGQGTIVYHQPAEPLFGLVGLTVDLNGGGQADAQFYNASYFPGNYYATGASGVGSTRLLVTPQGPYDGGSYLVALSAGFAIGGPTNEFLFWAAQDAPNGYGQAAVVGTYLPDEGNLIPDGDFYGTTAFMGIHFQAGSEWHYGWIRIRGGVAGPSDDGQQFYLNPPGWMLDWAYDTRPDAPILAGAVPEPSALSLLLLSGAAFWLVRKAARAVYATLQG